MSVSKDKFFDVVIREEMYRYGGLFLVISKIFVNDLLSEFVNVLELLLNWSWNLCIEGIVFVKLIMGFVIFYVERILYGS